MQGKTCIVTGANSGIGFSTAAGLARQGARLVLVCRSPERGEEARRMIVRLSGNEEVDLLVADLSSQGDIRRLAERFGERYEKLDVLVNNAGGVFAGHRTNGDGFEMTFALNYLAPFLLTHLLLDKLKAAGSARIVNVASTMQAKRLDPDEAARPERYRAFKAYREAKLAVLLMTYYLAEKLADDGIAANALHPGTIYTPQSSRMVPAFARPLIKLFMSSPEQGASTSLFLATSPEAGSISGRYFNVGREARTVPVSYDKALQLSLYEKSLRWTGIAR